MSAKGVQIAFRADDAGSCESANRAIAEGIAAGTVKNVSVMACGPALEHAALLLRKIEGIDLGLHVTLNAEWVKVKWSPVLHSSQVPTLLEPGTPHFTATPLLPKERGFSQDEAVAEAEAQLRRVRSLGLKIAYMDEHMGIGSLLGLGPALRELCHRDGILHLVSLDLMPLPKVGGDTLVDRWLLALQTVSPGTYLVVTHPGQIAPDMEAFFETGGTPGVIAKERDAERLALADPRLQDGLSGLGIAPIRFSEIAMKP